MNQKIWKNLKNGERKIIAKMRAKKLFNDVNLDIYPKIVIKDCLLYLLAQNNKVVHFKLRQRSEKQNTLKIKAF